MKIGEYLKDYRKRMGLSQRKLAERCGLSNSLISMLEKGVNPSTGKPIALSLEKYKALATGTGTTVQEMFETLGEDAPVLIENPHTMTFDQPGHQIHPDVIPMLNGGVKETKEVRIISSGVSKLPEDAQKRLLDIIRLTFDEYKDYFKDDEGSEDK